MLSVNNVCLILNRIAICSAINELNLYKFELVKTVTNTILPAYSCKFLLILFNSNTDIQNYGLDNVEMKYA